MLEKISNIALLGSTGSIGVNTLEVVRRNPNRFKVAYLATNKNIELLREQIAEFKPRAVAVTDPASADRLRGAAPSVEVLEGEEGLVEIAKRADYDTLIGAIVGFAGLRPTIEAARNGRRLCLANKETLVVAGELLIAIAKQTASEILPIDSEHSAIYQCLVGEDPESIKRIILTASGGPFRASTKEELTNVTVEQALKHPNWVMGRKITIDSATLMNKGLEVIEAKWLFGVPLEKVDVIVHPQSIVHSFVEFVDGSVKAQLGAPDMRLPIQYALSAPDRLPVSYELLDLLQTTPLEFYEPDLNRFPCLRLAQEAGQMGGLYPTILNAANEVVVEAFLERRIGFMDIPVLIGEALDSADAASARGFSVQNQAAIESSLERIFACDASTREGVLRAIETREVALS